MEALFGDVAKIAILMLHANLGAKLINIKSYKFPLHMLMSALSEAEGLYFANEVKIKATNSTEPMKKMFEKARNAFIVVLAHG